jgi:hypothetical protein
MLNMTSQQTFPKPEDILSSLTEAPPTTQELLSGSFWRLSDIDGQVLCPFLILAPNGLIGNFTCPSVDYWQVVNGRLCLIDKNGLPSVSLNVAAIQDGKLTALAGRGTIEGKSSIFFLQQVEHPAHPLFATPATTPRQAQFITQRGNGERRPYLIVVPAGAKSLHPHWFEGLTDMTRNWDLCVGYYGAEEPQVASPYEYLAHIPKTKKFRLLYNLFYPGSPLWDYEAIWLPDDDLLCDGASLNTMFHLFRKLGLELAQPSLKQGPGCFPNHPLTVQRPGNTIRYERFIEIMCPIFTKEALKICIGSMRDVESGYGLDHLWPAFLGYPQTKLGIIDAVAVQHTRPIGATYDLRAAVDEQTAVHHVYQHTMRKLPGVW